MTNLAKENKEINQNGLSKLEKMIRNFENTKYFGYMFFISYNGNFFDSFDENPNEKSVKSEFNKLLKLNEITIFKGIQQAGRTDKNVSAKENILYINSKNIIKFENLKSTEIEGLKILKIVKTVPFLEFPEMIEKRFYIYEYPENLIKNNKNTIEQLCKELSGKRNFKKFTSKKGEKLKNHEREINIEFIDNKLYFEGDGFLPQQVRIMSNFILNNKLSALDGKYLILDKVKISDELKKLCFEKVENLKVDKVKDIEKNSYFYIFYVMKKYKSEIIGKNGKNIKKLKKEYGNIVVKEV